MKLIWRRVSTLFGIWGSTKYITLNNILSNIQAKSKKIITLFGQCHEDNLKMKTQIILICISHILGSRAGLRHTICVNWTLKMSFCHAYATLDVTFDLYYRWDLFLKSFFKLPREREGERENQRLRLDTCTLYNKKLPLNCVLNQ